MTAQGPARDESYCARCLSIADTRDVQCAECDAPFTGSGAFNRLMGTPPATRIHFDSGVRNYLGAHL